MHIMEFCIVLIHNWKAECGGNAGVSVTPGCQAPESSSVVNERTRYI